MAHNYFFALSGNIGVGKTTWTRLLSERFNWKPYYEKVVENPYLQDFYKDMKRWSYHSQLFFLTQRFKENLIIQQSTMTSIQDRTIFEDAEIFAFNLYSQNNMEERDYNSYLDLYNTITNALRYPDLIIYLRASIWTLISRIRKRGREYEKEISKEYLAQLNARYEKWVAHYSKNHRVLIVNTDDFDIHHDDDRLREILERIGSYEAQMELFPNLGLV